MALDKLALSGLRLLQPEKAHRLTLGVLENLAFLPGVNNRPYKSMEQELMGIRFCNPVGIAAGLDKDGKCINGLVSLGVGFVELGGVTPKPQPGNSGDRVMRLTRQQGMINRLGFNNLGVEQLSARIKGFREKYYNRHKVACPTIIGVNIGKNATTPIEDAADDYLHVLKEIHCVADYVTINISSPNTEGLRRLQKQEFLAPLLDKLTTMEIKLSKQNGKKCPLVVKVSPDLSEGEIRNSIKLINSSAIAGVIATNSSSEHPWQDKMRGGISGRPLAARASEVLGIVRDQLNKDICLIACGGIDSKQEMQNRLAQGADLIQLYTALVYKGGGLVGELALNL